MSIQGMIASIKANKRKRKSVFDDKKERIDATYGDFLDHTKMTSSEFKKFQIKLKRENQIRQQKFLIKSIISIIVLILIAVYFLFFFNL